jgi:DNA-binding transcriptional MocR family regulator
MNERFEAVWVPALTDRSGPIYLRIVEAIAEARAEGVLRPGDRLLPQRELARRLAIDLTTVTRAFSEARRRNLIDATAGRGSFVTARGEETPILDLGMNIPPPPLGFNLPALIRSGIDAILRRSSAEALLSYHPGPGSPAERGAAAIWLERAAGGRLPLERVAVGAGAQAILAAILLSETAEGDAVLMDALTYPGFAALVRDAGRRPVGVEADGEGMLPGRLSALAGEHAARLVYLNPTLHNPTVLVMPAGRRRDLAMTAERAGLRIVEDDPYRPLLGEAAPPAFLSLAPRATFHVATLSKSLSPFLRTAFLAAPSAAELDGVARRLRGLTLMAPPLMTSLAAEWIRSGTADGIVAGVRAETAARHAIAAAVLPPSARMHAAGFHAWMELAPGRSAERLVAGARAQALAVSPATDFAVADDPPEAIRIALGAIDSRERLRDALAKLAGTMRQASPAGGALV